VDTFAAGSPTDSLQGLVFGSDDHLYVADADNNRVRRFDGQSGAFMDDFVPPGYGGLNHAEDVLFGLDGNLYVTSHYTDSILKYDSATGGHLGSFTTTGLDAPTYMLLVPEPGSLAPLVLAGLLGARRR
jgi:DNA-binding beta-propeller fold protein YncE